MISSIRESFGLFFLILGLSVVWFFKKVAVTETLDVTTDYGVYVDNAGTRVHTPVIKVASKFNDKINMLIRYSIDSVTAASRNAQLSKTHQNRSKNCGDCHTAPDVITGASKNFDEARGEFLTSLGYKSGDNSVDLKYVGSRERDYISDTVGVSFAREFFQKNTTVSLSLKNLTDKASFGIRPGEHFHKSGNSVETGITHTLTSKTLVGVSYGLDKSEGLIANLYKKLDLDGDPVTEILPSSRKRQFVTFRLNQALPWRTTAQLGYRNYHDDWGIYSKTASLGIFKKIGESFVLNPSYRYYTQTASTFYKDHFITPETYMTADYNLAPFKAHQFGLRGLVWLNPVLSLELGYERYYQQSTIDFSYGPRDSDLSSDIIQAELSVSY